MSLIENEQPLLVAEGLTKWYGRRLACRDASFELYEGEVIAVVGESGSGKTTLLQLLSGQIEPSAGQIRYRLRDGTLADLWSMSEPMRRFLFRTDWGYVHQDPQLGLRMGVSAGGNVGERLMAVGWRNYGDIRGAATDWLARVEIPEDRIDDTPRAYSGGMRQRLQIARNLVTAPRSDLHGRTDRRPRCLGAGPPARLAAKDRLGDAHRGHRGYPRSGCRTAVIQSNHGDEGRRGHRARPHRSGAGRPARALHPVARLLDPAGVRFVMVALELSAVAKTFTMHLQGGLRLAVLNGVTFAVEPEQCIALTGPSGTGKSSILKLIYGNYRCDAGQILVRNDRDVVDIASAAPRQILGVRQRALGYVTQFLRAVPRVSALDIVAEPLVMKSVPRETATARAAAMLRRFNVPERLWSLPPATFSGGEQQRINLARGLLPEHPILLLDEPTASLDADNRAVVVDIVRERKRQGAAIVAIVHDDDVREAIADDCVDVTQFAAAA